MRPSLPPIRTHLYYRTVASLALAAAAGVGIAVGAAPLTATGTPRPILSLPFLLVFLSLAGALWHERVVRDLAFFSPLALASFVYAVMFAGVPLADVWFGNPVVSNPSWWLGSWLVLVGLWCLLLGYHQAFAVWTDRDRGLRSVWHPRKAQALAAAGVGVALASVFGSLGGISGISMLINNFAARTTFTQASSVVLVGVSQAAPAIALVAATWTLRPEPRRGLAVLLLWLPPAILASAYLGQRWRALSILVSLLAIFHLGHRRFRGPVLAALAAALIALFVFVGQERNVVGTTRTRSNLAGQGLYDNYIGTGHELGQFRDFVTTIDGVPARLPFQYGRTFLSLIPTAPYNTGGYLFSQTFYPTLFAAHTSIPSPLPGELYLNFGLPGVFVGMALFGFALGSLEAFYRRNIASVGALAVYGYSMLPVALVLRGDFTTFAGYYVAGLVPLLLILRIVERRIGGAAGVGHPTGGVRYSSEDVAAPAEGKVL